MQFTRRHTLKFAGISCAATALAGALRAEGGASAAADPTLPFALTTPMHIGKAALRVRELDPMIDYYRSVLGMNEVERTARGVTLGVGTVPLLDLDHKPAADFESPTSAGLFHVAYLMPSRKDLARWLVHAALKQVPLTGFADHNVSEAIYLNDPEGNGIEVYSDRPTDTWVWSGNVVKMGTEPPASWRHRRCPRLLRRGRRAQTDTGCAFRRVFSLFRWLSPPSGGEYLEQPWRKGTQRHGNRPRLVLNHRSQPHRSRGAENTATGRGLCAGGNGE